MIKVQKNIDKPRKKVYNMDNNEKQLIRLTEAEIKAIESVINADRRAEVIPTKDGVKIFKLSREQVNKPAFKR